MYPMKRKYEKDLTERIAVRFNKPYKEHIRKEAIKLNASDAEIIRRAVEKVHPIEAGKPHNHHEQD